MFFRHIPPQRCSAVHHYLPDSNTQLRFHALGNISWTVHLFRHIAPQRCSTVHHYLPDNNRQLRFHAQGNCNCMLPITMTPLKYRAGPAGRPAGPAGRVILSRSMSRSTGWGICTDHGGLKLQGSTFLNELNRLAKESDLEDIATWPDRKPPPVTPLSRPCHAPVTLLSR